jgi:serine/threonine protein phosphatase PrpC
MASTLVVAVISMAPATDGSREVYVLQVGDSSGWVLRSGRWLSMGEVKNEGVAIAESMTVALPLVPEVAPSLARGHLVPGDVLVLLTDGIGDALGSGRGEVGAALAELWATPPDPVQFAAQVGFGRKTFDDDRTALAVWPAEVGDGPR